MKSKLLASKVGVEVVIAPKSTKFPVIWALSTVSIIGEDAWYSPYWVSTLVPKSIPSTFVVVFSVKVFVAPKSIWAFESNVVASAVVVKSTFSVVELVYWPIWPSEEVPSDFNTFTEAKSLVSKLVWISDIWVSILIWFVVVWNWLKSSVWAGRVSVGKELDVSANFELEVAGYSPYPVVKGSVFINVSIMLKYINKLFI